MISIVIPVYNSGRWVEETLNSVLKQSYQDFEIIFVNDGSTDNSAEVLEQLKLRDSRIRVVHQPNGKQGKARNNGILHAIGDWVAFLDADDLWSENKLEAQLKRTLESGADMSFTDGFICLNNQMDLRTHRFGVKSIRYSGKEGVLLFHAQNRVPTSSVLVKKSALIAVGGFPESLEVQNCEDYLLWTRLLSDGYVLQGIEEPWLFYRVHPESSTGLEVKGLMPLLAALLVISGGATPARNQHLEKTLLRLLELLKESGELQKLNRWIGPVLREIRGGIPGFILSLIWKINQHLAISLIWRSRAVKN